jgi:hypothetical protein
LRVEIEQRYGGRGGSCHSAELYYRRDLMAARVSRSVSRRLIVSRLS